ncbi:hypothetical protein NEOLEDRAFT_605845 [Neolentinus lepideus HHB14362 ss-1]|uniref:C3H1-type domain-containing protein n=1 Tax=Neolentinus lepideus HHB14362 ss-1 TaxID=1314782 RepID=A0A165VD69_9AGAM|nr:hypothetical protein NEOLEDRAFT_605845 [Neolentinus lepideus HHB14362 ss-1]
MVVCQYYMQGRCKFGNSCRNEHPRDGRGHGAFGNSSWNSGGNQKVPVPFSMETMTKDMTPQVDKPMWPLSSYGPAKHEPLLVAGLDESPEELRVKAMLELKSGTVNEYIKYEAEKIAAADQIYVNARAHVKEAYDQASKISMANSEAAGGSGLGTRSSQSAFGSSTFGNTSSSSVFGANIPSTTTTPAFGKPLLASAFGQSHQQQSSSIFGQPKQSSSVFGQPQPPSTSIFGQPQQSASAFGQPQQSASAFGQPQQSTSAFGQPWQSTSAFGQPQQSPSAFGQPQPSTSAFGQPSTSVFGQSQSSTSAFGQPQQSTTTSVFGQPPQGQTASAFGQPQQSASAFGQPQQQTISGQPQPSMSSFGQPPQQISVFGQSSQPATNSFIRPATGAFGQSAFGGSGTSGGSAFGASIPAANSISAGAFSAFAERRPAGFGAGPTTTEGSVFGQPSLGSAPSAFGNPAPAPNNSNPSAFGSASVFGNQSQTQTNTLSPFGSNIPQSSVFGSGGNSGSAFGGTPGSNSTPSAFGPVQTSSVSASAPQPAPSTSVFGSSTNTPSSTSVFGTAPTQTQKPKQGPPDFANATVTYKPDINQYDAMLPENYLQILPASARNAFESKKFEWGNIPEWIPPKELR